MYSFPDLELVVCFMSSYNCCFLICIQMSQEAGKVVWYSHLFKSFPQFVVIYTAKGFGIVNKAEIDVFLELSCFFDDPADVANLISGSSAFSKSKSKTWTSGSLQFTCCWSLAWRILSITLLACEMSATVWKFEHSLVLPFFGIGMKTFPSCGHCWVFQICWHTECSIFTASCFKIWNSSTRIPSPALALFVVMLPRALRDLERNWKDNSSSRAHLFHSLLSPLPSPVSFPSIVHMTILGMLPSKCPSWHSISGELDPSVDFSPQVSVLAGSWWV